MKKFKKIIFIILILFSNFTKATVTANYSPQNVNLGETIELTLTIDNANKSGSPNLMPLLKDFEVISTSRSYSFADINGKTSSEAKWTIILKPKHAGEISIPALNIGNEQSQSLTVNVSTANVQNDKTYNNNSTYTILKTKINEKQPFINQQTLYTVKLYNRQQLFNGQYKAPEVENALIVPLGEGKSYQTTFQGEIYNVEELSYAIFPQKEGKITINPPEFSAEVIDGFSPTKIRLSAKPISINVKPLSPGKNIENWLAAENVIINEDYDNPTTTYIAGDTIIRNITIKATGMVAQLLPKLSFKNNDNYNVYANKPHLENTIIDGKIIATATYKVTYLLTKATNTEIPAIKIPWYNINTKTNLTAKLPAKAIIITQNTNNIIKPISKEIKLNETPQPKSKNLYIPIIGIILMFIILISIIKIKNKKTVKHDINPSVNNRYFRKFADESVLQDASSVEFPKRSNIQRACKAGDPMATYQAILAFARQEWPELKILNLNNIPIDDEEFKQEITKLMAIIYGKSQDNSWSGEKLWQIFSKLKIKKPRKKNQKTLPPIYLH